MLHSVLIPEFGDLISRVCRWMKTQYQEKVPNHESPGDTPLPRFVEVCDVSLFESRGTVARHFAKFKESCAVDAVILRRTFPVLGNELNQRIASSCGVAGWIRSR